MAEKNVSRRDFMKVAGWAASVTGFTAVTIPILAYFYPARLEEIPDEPQPAGLAADLPVGASTTIPYGRYPALVIHTENGLKAYSAVCTHFACLVKWDPDSGEIVCPCHDGFFDPLNGDVLRGPPPTPLQAFPVAVGADGQIYVGLEEDAS